MISVENAGEFDWFKIDFSQFRQQIMILSQAVSPKPEGMELSLWRETLTNRLQTLARSAIVDKFSPHREGRRLLIAARYAINSLEFDPATGRASAPPLPSAEVKVS